MVLYFSGTGNSRYAAKLIAKTIDDDFVSINDYIKKGEPPELLSDKPYVFVCPAYAWRLPRVVERFIKDAVFNGSRKAYFVMTCGSETGNAAFYAEKLCRETGLFYMGFASIIMPENYIALFDVPERKQADAIIKKAEPYILKAARLIGEGQRLPRDKKSLKSQIMSRLVNVAFYLFIVSAKGFYATDGCTGCGKCVQVCPLNNIRLTDERPAWGRVCTHCMACISRCPVEAIEYKKKSVGKPRYYLQDKRL